MKTGFLTVCATDNFRGSIKGQRTHHGPYVRLLRWEMAQQNPEADALDEATTGASDKFDMPLWGLPRSHATDGTLARMQQTAHWRRLAGCKCVDRSGIDARQQVKLRNHHCQAIVDRPCALLPHINSLIPTQPLALFTSAAQAGCQSARNPNIPN